MVTGTDPVARTDEVDARAAFRALGLLAARIGLIGAAAALGWLALNGPAGGVTFPPLVLIGLLLMPVNLICLVLVRRLVHAEGRRLRDLIGYRSGRLRADIGWGLLWLIVLYLPFAATIVVVVALLYGSDAPAAFGTILFDPGSVPRLSPAVLTALAVVTAVTFAPLNAPVEELVYRGYAHQALTRRWRPAVAIGVSAAAFGLQHVFFAPTSAAVVVYLAAFTVWGIGAGIIVHRQGRLLPMIIAHLLVNLAASAPVLVIATL